LAYPYVGWAFLLVNATVFCWLASSDLSWLGYAAVAAALGVLMYGLAIPNPLLMPRRVRLAAGAVGVTAAASAVRMVTLPTGTWGSATVGMLFLVLVMIGLAWVRYDWPRGTVQAVMIFPLAEGTWQVARGDLVRRGQVVGQVGNSGNSTEPHLHIHAERHGTGVRLRFEGIRRLSRGTRIKVTTSPAAPLGADGRSTTDPLPGP
jgi:hypothetical protein